MNKMLSALAVGLVLGVSAISTAAFAEEAAAPAAEAPAAEAPAAEAPAADATADAAVETKDVTFADGQTGVIHGDHVYISKMGIRTVAPDGEYNLSDGTTITVKDGMLVTAPAAEGTAGETAPATGEEAPAAAE